MRSQSREKYPKMEQARFCGIVQRARPALEPTFHPSHTAKSRNRRWLRVLPPALRLTWAWLMHDRGSANLSWPAMLIKDLPMELGADVAAAVLVLRVPSVFSKNCQVTGLYYVTTRVGIDFFLGQEIPFTQEPACNGSSTANLRSLACPHPHGLTSDPQTQRPS